jgi:hypothetical protein
MFVHNLHVINNIPFITNVQKVSGYDKIERSRLQGMEYINSRVDREGADLDQVCITKDNEPSVTTASAVPHP